MSKTKKRADGLYQISVVVTERGEKKRRYFYGHTQQEAKRKMMEWQEKRAAGRSFAEVAEECRGKHWEEISAGTQTCYAPALKRALADFADVRIGEIAPLDVKRAVDAMASQGYAHHSVGIYLSTLRQIFDYAVLVQDLKANPAETVRIPKGLVSNVRDCPEEDELNIIRRNADAHEFGLFPYMLLYTGLRRGEILALQWKDIDFKKRTVRVTKSVSFLETGNQPVVKSPKTKAGERKVVLMERLAEKLLPIRGEPEAYIFGGDKPLSKSVFRRRWRRCCLDVGLWRWKDAPRMKGRKKKLVKVKEPSVTPHQLRHAFATMCFERGVSAKDAQQLLGHSKIDVTLDTYTHIRAQRRTEVAEKLNGAE